jgi:hypothetical protein
MARKAKAQRPARVWVVEARESSTSDWQTGPPFVVREAALSKLRTCRTGWAGVQGVRYRVVPYERVERGR